MQSWEPARLWSKPSKGDRFFSYGTSPYGGTKGLAKNVQDITGFLTRQPLLSELEYLGRTLSHWQRNPKCYGTAYDNLDWHELIERALHAVLDEIRRRDLQSEGVPVQKPEYMPTMTELLLFKVLQGCPELDRKTREKPGHLQVFWAALKGFSLHEMENKNKWPRRTAANRLRKVENSLLGGLKVSSFRVDWTIMRNFERQQEAAHGAKIWGRTLLGITPKTQSDDAHD